MENTSAVWFCVKSGKPIVANRPWKLKTSTLWICVVLGKARCRKLAMENNSVLWDSYSCLTCKNIKREYCQLAVYPSCAYNLYSIPLERMHLSTLLLNVLTSHSTDTAEWARDRLILDFLRPVNREASYQGKTKCKSSDSQFNTHSTVDDLAKFGENEDA